MAEVSSNFIRPIPNLGTAAIGFSRLVSQKLVAVFMGRKVRGVVTVRASSGSFDSVWRRSAPNSAQDDGILQGVCRHNTSGSDFWIKVEERVDAEPQLRLNLFARAFEHMHGAVRLVAIL